MTMTDPIADMLTRIRNAYMASYDKLEIPCSKMKVNIAKILKSEGYIKDYKVNRGTTTEVMAIYLKYNKDNNPAINGLKRVSKPSCRVYSKCENIPRLLHGLGINIVSTSRGVMTDREARKMGVGGEILCSIW